MFNFLSAVPRRHCEKWFDLGYILKVEQQELPRDWKWGVRMKSKISRFVYKCVISVI